jgi:predicted O-methyltransferase YrrM
MSLTSKILSFLPQARQLSETLRTIKPELTALHEQVAALRAEQTRRTEQAPSPCQGSGPLPEIPAVRLFVPPGHYYSPIVQPAHLSQQGAPDQRAPDELKGLSVEYGPMETLFERLIRAKGTHAFPVTPHPDFRYYSDNDMYGPGDAIILAAVLRHFRPRRWIEVGSGFSSAALLDTLDRERDLQTQVTFIEPNSERLDALLREGDRARVTVMKIGVQAVPLSVFDQLAAGDVLFLDTTHVSKTGSDVNHEFFQIFPRLASGVIIHLHDIFSGFEYPDDWIYQENRSWNEQYLLRAFLMFNSAFEVLYANDGFSRTRSDLVQARCPAILANPGGGFWMRKRE